MKRGTKILIAVTLMLYGAELLCVPFEVRYANGLSQHIVFSFILRPPESRELGKIVIQWDYVFTEILATTLVAAIAYYLKTISSLDRPYT